MPVGVKEYIFGRRGRRNCAIFGLAAGGGGQPHVPFTGTTEDFESYSLGAVEDSIGAEDRPNGWASAWIIHQYVPKAEDDLATYSIGATAAPLGTTEGGWASGWNAEDLP